MPTRRRKPHRAGALTELPPLKIIRSIVLLQLAYYTVATILIVFIALVLGQQFTPSLILDWRTIRGDITDGWTIGFAWLLTGFVTYVYSSYCDVEILTYAPTVQYLYFYLSQDRNSYLTLH